MNTKKRPNPTLTLKRYNAAINIMRNRCDREGRPDADMVRLVSIHQEPSRVMDRPKITRREFSISFTTDHWENSAYYGTVKRFAAGSPIGGGEWALISIIALDETARHDFREYQQLKNLLVGDEWEAIEVYPSESKLVDPSNNFYLWAFPPSTLGFGLPVGRRVLDAEEALMPQRPFSA